MERMHIRLGMLIKTTMAMLCAGIALTSIGAVAQGTSKFDKTKLVGAWTLVSIDNTLPDGKRMQGFGSNDGVVIFEPNGRFVQALARSDLPKFASNNRSAGSPDENKAVVQGSLILFGTYSVADDGALTLHMERSTFPNWNGSDQKRTITSLTSDELKWHNPAASIGGTTETAWKRAQ
ncbi:MAG: hypothetical protein QOC84_1350 [Bradyrhizobium sp.]|nr:hypothetical protein [Bradyrhizobium sp.]